MKTTLNQIRAIEMLAHDGVKQAELLAALQYVRTHLYAAQAQMIPGDDSIIMRHVYDAYRRIAEVCREVELHGISRLGPIQPPKEISK